MRSLDAMRNFEDCLRQTFLAIAGGQSIRSVDGSGGERVWIGDSLWDVDFLRVQKLIDRGLLHRDLKITLAGKRFYVQLCPLNREESEYAWLLRFQPTLA